MRIREVAAAYAAADAALSEERFRELRELPSAVLCERFTELLELGCQTLPKTDADWVHFETSTRELVTFQANALRLVRLHLR